MENKDVVKERVRRYRERQKGGVDAARLVKPKFMTVNELVALSQKIEVESVMTKTPIECRVDDLSMRVAALEGDLAVIRGLLKNILERPLARDGFAPECPFEKDNGESIV